MVTALFSLKIECAAYNPEPYEMESDSCATEHGFLWVSINFESQNRACFLFPALFFVTLRKVWI